MFRGVPQPQKSEKVFVTLDAELSAQVLDFGRAIGVENKPELIRILVRQSLAAVPWGSEQLHLLREGLNSARHWAWGKFREKWEEVERESEQA